MPKDQLTDADMDNFRITYRKAGGDPRTVRAAYIAAEDALPEMLLFKNHDHKAVHMVRRDEIIEVERLERSELGASAQTGENSPKNGEGFLTGLGSRSLEAEKAMNATAAAMVNAVAGTSAPPASGPLTVYVSIGNSDDKLSQQRWHEFWVATRAAVMRQAGQVHGEWLSVGCAPYQNACICLEVDPGDARELKSELRSVATWFGQDSIAWAEVPETEFVRPSQTLPA